MPKNRSCAAPSRASPSQLTHSPLEHCSFTLVCPQASPQGTPASSLSHNPQHLPSKRLQWRDPWGASQESVDNVLAGKISNHLEALALNRSFYNRPSVSSHQSLGSSGIREMGCSFWSLMLMSLQTDYL